MRPVSHITDQTPASSGLKSQILFLDTVLGIAILGYLLVNGPTLNSPAIQDSIDFAFQNTQLDVWYSQLIFAFAVKSFYPMLAGIFGLLIAMHMQSKPKLLIRLMIALLVIGLVHMYLIFWGDTLAVFAVLGLSLGVFHKRLPGSVQLSLYVSMVIALLLSWLFYHLHNRQPMVGMAKAMMIYQSGNFFDISTQRWRDFLGAYVPGIFYKLDAFQVVDFAVFYVQLYMCILLGYWTYVSGAFRRLCEDANFTKRITLIAFSFTFFMGIIADSFVIMGEALIVIEGLSRASFYACTIIFLGQQPSFKRFFYPCSLVGRMGISNYIFHNLALSLIFYGYGLGLYGQIGPFTQAPILLGLMLVSLLLSSWWLKYFRYGPIEWLLNAATHARFAVFRKRASSAALCVKQELI